MPGYIVCVVEKLTYPLNTVLVYHVQLGYKISHHGTNKKTKFVHSRLMLMKWIKDVKLIWKTKRFGTGLEKFTFNLPFWYSTMVCVMMGHLIGWCGRWMVVTLPGLSSKCTSITDNSKILPFTERKCYLFIRKRHSFTCCCFFYFLCKFSCFVTFVLFSFSYCFVAYLFLPLSQYSALSGSTVTYENDEIYNYK